MDLDKIIASLEETAKVIENKIVLDPAVFEEIKASDAKTKEMVLAEQQKSAELQTKLEAVEAKYMGLECEKIVADTRSYVATKETEIVEAEAKIEKENNRRKEELTAKGFANDKVIACALKMDMDAYNAYVESLVIAKEVGHQTALSAEKKAILDGQKEFDKSVAANNGHQEMDLSTTSFVEGFKQAAKAAIKEVKQLNEGSK